MKITKKNSYIIYIIIALIFLGVSQYQKYRHNDEFTIDNVNITVGEVYSAYTIKRTEYCKYVYKVNNQLYKSGNSLFSREKTRDLKQKIENNGKIKYPIIYNSDNPNLNFLLNIEISDTLELGSQLPKEMISEEILKSRIKFTEIKTASTDEKDLIDYKKMIN